jgi:hypothetical protein
MLFFMQQNVFLVSTALKMAETETGKVYKKKKRLM